LRITESITPTTGILKPDSDERATADNYACRWSFAGLKDEQQ